MESILIRYGLAAVFLGGALEGDVTFTLVGEVRRIELWLLAALILSVSAFLILRVIFRHAIIATGIKLPTEWGKTQQHQTNR